MNTGSVRNIKLVIKQPNNSISKDTEQTLTTNKKIPDSEVLSQQVIIPGLSHEVVSGLTVKELAAVQEFVKSSEFAKPNVRAPYRLPKLIYKAKMAHGNKFNYDKITSNTIIDRDFKVPIICNKCNTELSLTISAHIVHKVGCYYCSKTGCWTYEKFTRKSKEIYGDRFDYSLVVASEIINSKSFVSIKCNICQNIKHQTSKY